MKLNDTNRRQNDTVQQYDVQQRYDPSLVSEKGLRNDMKNFYEILKVYIFSILRLL